MYRRFDVTCETGQWRIPVSSTHTREQGEIDHRWSKSQTTSATLIRPLPITSSYRPAAFVSVGRPAPLLDQASSEIDRSSGPPDPGGRYGHPSIITHGVPVAISTHWYPGMSSL